MLRALHVLAILISFSAITAANEIDSLLLVLEETMDKRDQFDTQKESRIFHIKELRNESGSNFSEEFLINRRLIDEYAAYKFDSAIFYIEQSLELANKTNQEQLQIEVNLKLAYLLSVSGRNTEAFEVLKGIKRNRVSDELLPEYLRVYRNYFSILSYYSTISSLSSNFKQSYDAYTDSLLAIIPENSDEYLSIRETQLLDARELDECLHINKKRLNQVKVGDPAYSMITFNRAIAYELLGDSHNMKKFFILSAISDIMNSVKDNASMAALAKILFREKEMEKAHQYIYFAYQDALTFNSELRFTQISDILPIINATFEQQLINKEKALKTSLIFISILSGGLILALILIILQVSRLKKAQRKLNDTNQQLNQLNTELSNANQRQRETNLNLSEANQLKEHYIGTFLSICSEYIHKLDSYRKMVNKHIGNKQISKLWDLTRSTDYIDHEKEEFYRNFDSTFLSIFPDFIEQLNKLLIEDARFKLKHDELLNTELRIFALIRLGITDSNNIASLLDYSVRTIYNYRVKFKNKMKVPRDDFDDVIGQIGARLK